MSTADAHIYHEHTHHHDDVRFVASVGSISTDSPTGRVLVDLINEADGLIEESAIALIDELENQVVPDLIDRIVETIQAGGGDDAQMRAAARAITLLDVQELLAEVGGDQVYEATVGSKLVDLRGYAAEILERGGWAGSASVLLSDEDVIAALTVAENTIDDVVWANGIRRDIETRMLTGLRRSLTLTSLDDLATQLEDHGLRWDHATTEARDGLAEYDRSVNEALSRSADPEGETLLRGYVGPDDQLERPFCDILNGKAFTVKELSKARNGQRGTVFTHCGGYRCRHRLISVTLNVLKMMGLVRGTPEDIQRANNAAAGKRGRRRRRR